ncbi:MAG: helix-turn-helix transcriptional regulator [Acidobacteriaceae bacterium]|nr:helix-turn-helix transcriptional regulator [Acidobacteriaceae bacterium]
MEEPKIGRVDQHSCRPKNWLGAVLLMMLLEGASYGYEMLEQLAKSFGPEAESVGTVYRTLRQMERDRLVKSCWETSISGPARRVYTITELGEAHLGVRTQALIECQSTIDDFLKSYHGKGA